MGPRSYSRSPGDHDALLANATFLMSRRWWNPATPGRSTNFSPPAFEVSSILSLKARTKLWKLCGLGLTLIGRHVPPASMHEVGCVHVLLFGSGVQRSNGSSADALRLFGNAARAETGDRMTLFDKSDLPSSVTYVRPFVGPRYFKQLRHFCGLSFGGGMLANF